MSTAPPSVHAGESSIDPPKKKRAKRGAVGKHKKVSLRELISLQVIIFYVYQMFSKVDDADIADEGEEWEEEDCDAGVEETEIKPPPTKNRWASLEEREGNAEAAGRRESSPTASTGANYSSAEGTSSHSSGEEECRTISVLCDPR